MKPFNLELAKAGLPLVTRDGRGVLEIAFLQTVTGCPIFAAIEGVKGGMVFEKDGSYNLLNYDLHMAPVCHIDGKPYYCGDVVFAVRNDKRLVEHIIDAKNWRGIREMAESGILKPARKRFSRMYLVEGETQARTVNWSESDSPKLPKCDHIWIGPTQEFYA